MNAEEELREARMGGAVEVQDGRSIGVAEFGVPDGKAILWLHGTSGGPYVLACAHELPERVVAGAVLGGFPPTCGDGGSGGIHPADETAVAGHGSTLRPRLSARGQSAGITGRFVR